MGGIVIAENFSFRPKQNEKIINKTKLNEIIHQLNERIIEFGVILFCSIIGFQLCAHLVGSDTGVHTHFVLDALIVFYIHPPLRFVSY